MRLVRRRAARVQRVSLVTRAGCPMCEEAEPVVAAVVREAGLVLEVLDVDADPALAQWSDHVPVVLLDGQVHARWWIDEPALRSALGLRGRTGS